MVDTAARVHVRRKDADHVAIGGATDLVIRGGRAVRAIARQRELDPAIGADANSAVRSNRVTIVAESERQRDGVIGIIRPAEISIGAVPVPERAAVELLDDIISDPSLCGRSGWE